MDIIAGLPAFGTYLNTKILKPVDDEYDTVVKRTPINGLNIYTSHNYKENKDYYDDLAYRRYQACLDPRASGLIPNFFNQFKDVEMRNRERLEKIEAELKPLLLMLPNPAFDEVPVGKDGVNTAEDALAWVKSHADQVVQELTAKEKTLELDTLKVAVPEKIL